MKTVVKSWKTTVAAVLAVVAKAALCGQAVLDLDPETVADWAGLVPLVGLAAGLIFARDSGVTSKEAGAE